MKIRTVAQSCLWLAWAFFPSPVSATECRDALLGDFATNPNGGAVLRIEKIDGKTISRMKNEDGTWAAEFHQAQVIPQNDLVKFFGEEAWAA